MLPFLKYRGDHISLFAVANEYKVIIWVYKSSGDAIVSPLDKDTRCQHRVLKLSLYDESQHYNAVECKRNSNDLAREVQEKQAWIEYQEKLKNKS